jgi:DNA-binding SARP family transcriptional activator
LAFGVLGAMEVRFGDQVVELKRAKQRALLAAGLLSANRVVSTGRLIDAIWGEEPPRSAPALVQNYVSALRRLGNQYGQPDLILTRAPGYVIQIRPAALDLHRFERLVTQSREARASSDDGLAARLLRTALMQWRGPALDGLDTPTLRAAAGRMDELRLAALEERIGVDARLGPLEPLAAELAELVQTHPLRERLRAQLMRVLYQLGRQGEALEVFLRGTLLLRDELGVDPGPDLRSAHRAILAADPALAPPRQVADLNSRVAARRTVLPVGASAPDQLPPAPSNLVGRGHEVRLITAELLLAARERRAVLCAISGMAGSGKTALALHIGNAVKDAFPDGRLFVPLRGTEGALSLDLRDALAMVLRSVGVAPADLPHSADERGALMRSALTGRRMLVVVDDALTDGHARPLLAALPGCAVLVTSRRLLVALDCQVRVDLREFARRDSVLLLADVVGSVRIGAEPGPVDEIAHLCGDVPLALRAAAARLVARPGWPLAMYAGILRDNRRRLDELSVGDLDVRASIERSHREVSSDEDMALRALGMRARTWFDTSWLATVLGVPVHRAEQIGERLVDARLLEPEAGRPGGYRVPELVRVFWRERAITQGFKPIGFVISNGRPKLEHSMAVTVADPTI